MVVPRLYNFMCRYSTVDSHKGDVAGGVIRRKEYPGLNRLSRVPSTAEKLYMFTS